MKIIIIWSFKNILFRVLCFALSDPVRFFFSSLDYRAIYCHYENYGFLYHDGSSTLLHCFVLLMLFLCCFLFILLIQTPFTCMRCLLLFLDVTVVDPNFSCFGVCWYDPWIIMVLFFHWWLIYHKFWQSNSWFF